MSLLWRYLRKDLGLVLLALLLGAISHVFWMLDPLILRYIVDRYAGAIEQYTASEFFLGVGALLAVAMGATFIGRIAKNVQDYQVNVITQRLGARLYADGIRHALELPYAMFEDQRSGETLGTLHKVRTDVEKFVTALINVLFASLVGVAFVTIYAFTVHWLIGPVFALSVPVLGIVSAVLSRRIKQLQRTIVAQTTSLAGSATESLRNIELVKSLGLGPQEIDRLHATTNKILALELKKVRRLRSLRFVQGTVINVIRTSIMFVMLSLVYQGTVTTGQFFSLLIYSFVIFGPLQELGNVVNQYRETEASLLAFDAILQAPAEPQPLHPRPARELRTLSFERVTFQHSSAVSPAVRDVTFSVRRGETIAFVGPSGAGKSTLLKLLVGLYAPGAGEIYYDGVPRTELDLATLREQIGFVSQDSQLFSGTIRENLRFVRPQATDRECHEALRRAACDAVVSRAAHGLDTMIGEGGVKLSGGEKQRLSIARALLRRPRLLVFDEATSSLDSLTEAGVVDTIRGVAASGEAITIVVAHRLSTTRLADRIYVLERGRIVETGRHHELVAQKGLYYAMWRQQIGERRGEAEEEGAVVEAAPSLQPTT